MKNWNPSTVHTFTNDSSPLLSMNHLTQNSCKGLSAVRTGWPCQELHPACGLVADRIYIILLPANLSLPCRYPPLPPPFPPAGTEMVTLWAGSGPSRKHKPPGCWPHPYVCLLCFVLGEILLFWYNFSFTEKLHKQFKELLQLMICLFTFLPYLLYHSLSFSPTLLSHWRWRCAPIGSSMNFPKRHSLNNYSAVTQSGN